MHLKNVKRDWFVLACLTFCFSFGFAIYNGVFQNFIKDIFHAGPEKLGVLESLREVPGLLVVFVAASLVALSERHLASVALLVFAAGVGLSGEAHSYWQLVGLTVLWSVGGHLWFSVSPSITLALSEGQDGGKRLGQMGSVGAAAVLLALLFTRIVKQYLSYAALFRLAGAVLVVAAGLCLLLSRHTHSGKRRSLVYRREYRLYYLLTFLEGCRRQIFGTFASFVLISAFGVPVTTMVTLALVNAVVGMLANPLIGRMIDLHGERKMLTIYYTAVTFIFVGYTVFNSVHSLFGLYMVDNLMFGFAMGITTYLHKIVRPGELTPSLTMGTTMNHVAAVVMPVTGGILWKTMGNYRIPFYIGLVVVIVSLGVTQLLTERRLPTQRGREAAAAGRN